MQVRFTKNNKLIPKKVSIIVNKIWRRVRGVYNERKKEDYWMNNVYKVDILYKNIYINSKYIK